MESQGIALREDKSTSITEKKAGKQGTEEGNCVSHLWAPRTCETLSGNQRTRHDEKRESSGCFEITRKHSATVGPPTER
jgi:hypothetical protein